MSKWLIENHDLFESVAAFATAFALLVQLPAYLIGKRFSEREHRRERAHAYLQEMLKEGDEIEDRGRKILRAPSLKANVAISAIGDSDRKALLSFMNRYEFLAVSIRHKRIDESTIRLWMNAKLIRDWHLAAPLVADIRTTSGPAVFYEWERLAHRWNSLSDPIRTS